jgi:hypothetical protein
MPAITSSEMTPGPLGILETRPSAAAPASMAITASSRLRMQQIFTRGLRVARIRYPYHPKRDTICFGTVIVLE